MAAGKHTFIIEQGSTFNNRLVYTDSNGDTVDLSGYTARMQIRPDYADFTNTVYISLTDTLNDTGSGIILGGTSGSIDITISATDTETFNFDGGFYDLELESNGYVSRLLEGKIKIRREVSR